MTGYSPSRLTFLEKMIEQAGGDPSDELRAEYEAALLQKDQTLAIEEAERSKFLGLPDIGKQGFIAVLDYGEQTTKKLEIARTQKQADLRTLGLGGVSARLALLSGDTREAADISADLATPKDLPAYYDAQAERVQEIANERANITDKRLSNFEPIYPESELQTELKENLILGISITKGCIWISVEIDAENNSAKRQVLGDALRSYLDEEDYATVIAKGNAVSILPRMEHIDLQDLIGVAVSKYIDKHKKY
jgi:hypothetical protein